tara:strand:- start:401 stop:643 length:243 start_codon:yes stop_codon:yes gene_type:complete
MEYNLRDIERHGIDGKIPESEQIIRMKARRNALLKASDWTQTPDNPISNKAEWATYRQALRDFPATWTPSDTANFPDEPS